MTYPQLAVVITPVQLTRIKTPPADEDVFDRWVYHDEQENIIERHYDNPPIS
jgi:hypothetical protein